MSAKHSKQFVNDLSDVYRYVLQHKDKDLVELQDELRFLRAFSNLLQRRHGDAMCLYVNVPSKYGEMLVPPLSLQLLVENGLYRRFWSKDFTKMWVSPVENCSLRPIASLGCRHFDFTKPDANNGAGHPNGEDT